MLSNLTLTVKENILLFYRFNHDYYSMENYKIILISIIFGILTLVGCIENGYSLYIILSRKKLRTLKNIFIGNLAFTDIFMCSIVEPFNIYQMIVNQWEFGFIMCKTSKTGELEMTKDIYLDKNIQIWALFPITLVTLLFSVIRHYATFLFTNKSPDNLKQIHDTQVVNRCQTLRKNFGYIPKRAFLMRLDYFALREDAYLKLKQKNSENPTPQDPMAMMDMMKGNFFNIFSMIVIGGWVNWVSSISWCFLNFFGLRSAQNLLLNEKSDSSMMPMPGAPMSGMQDMTKAYKSESEALTLICHKWKLDNIVDEVIDRFEKK
ncbi:ER membrane protein complex subunit 3 [Intoshia linei]|uniref:ER membrane protein complex subunit 3 n=1 Tax=Intoshia linei TaxID=1819745 RepID=A0A177BC01_9BILA|nr:ER membrane protein complex subunit 3 [Intoshia linei]